MKYEEEYEISKELVTVQLLKKPDSKYPLPQEQLDKYHRIKKAAQIKKQIFNSAFSVFQ